MLLIKNQFILKSAIKNPLYLLNPPLLTEDQITLPRFSVIHYLDTKTNSHFPSRDLYYFKDLTKNKKIPIHFITDLDNKDEISVIENKYANTEIRKWIQANLRNFKAVDLFEIPNTDSNVISVFDYGLLTDLYKYKTSLLSKHFKHYNLYKTYYNTIKKALSVDKESVHFVTIDLPNNIPNYAILDVILKFNTVKFSRVISDPDLLKIIDIYRWLSSSTKKSSTLSDITDEDSERIIIEFKYKGYSSFLPLSIIRGLSDDSKIESAIKYNNEKVKKIFILMLHKIQNNVNALLENNSIDTTNTEILTQTDITEIDNPLNNESDIEESTDSTQETNIEIKSITPEVKSLTTPKELKLNKSLNLDTIGNQLETSSVDDIINKTLREFQNEATDVDEIYEEAILKANAEQEETTQFKFDVDYSEETVTQLLRPKTLDTAFDKFIQEAVEFKTMTSTEIRNLRKLKETRATLSSPYDKDSKLDDFKIVTPKDTSLTHEEMALAIANDLIDDNLKKEVINTFDKKYVKQVLRKDVISCVSNLEKSGVIIKNYEIEENRSSVNNYEVHKLTVKPLSGKESTIYFRLPKIDEEGEFIGSGIKYRMRKTRQPVPIVKVSPTKVALTSNYSKLFVFRTERKANDPYNYIVDYIRKSYLNEQGIVEKVIPGLKTLNQLQLPNIYTTLASNFNEVRTTKATFLLNYKERAGYLDSKVLSDIESKKLIFCGYLPNKHILVVGYDDLFYDYTNNLSLVGSITDLLEIDNTKLPKAFSAIKILGDNIPLGICLSYYLGLTGLLSVTQTQYKLIEANSRYTPQAKELVIKFLDYKLVVTLDTTEKELLFNGYVYYKDFIKQHAIKEFDYKEIYLNILESRDSGLIHLKELNLLEELFLDPITVDVLRSMNEPTDFLKLLLRANQLLNDFSHPDVNDPNYSRIRGYDRVPGLMYRALSESIRDFKIKGRSNSKIELDPYKVWNYITQDNTVKISEDINPILDVKEAETLTLSGADGLNKDATPKQLRRYHKNDIGLVSEGTVDSSDVALNTYLSPYAKLKDIRGRVDTENNEVLTNQSKAFSTSVQLAPMSEFDD